MPDIIDNMTDLNKIYQKDPNIVSREILGETILVPIRQNVGDMESIYTLNETGALVWSLLDGELSLEEIRNQLVDKYDVDEEDAAHDIFELITQLDEISAVQEL